MITLEINKKGKKMKYEVENGYLVDKTNNKVDLNRFDIEKATTMLDSLIKCKDCVDCDGCYECIECIFCKYCKNCEDCDNCKNCDDCVECCRCDGLNSCIESYNISI